MRTKIYLGIISFLLFPIFSFSSELNEDKDLAKNIKANIMEDGFSIYLTWTPPEAEGEIIIARSKERMDTPEKLYYADSLGRYPNKGSNKMSSFKDINLKPGVYYYAVVMVSRVKKRDVILVPDQNYTYNPIDIGQPTQIIKIGKNEILPYAHDNAKSVSDIEVRTFKDYNQIRWAHPLNAEVTKPTYHLYRSEEPLSSLPLLKQAKKIVELKYPENFYVDRNFESGKIYYYGVSVSIAGEEYLPLVEHKSFIRTAYSTPLRREEPKEEKVQENKPQNVVSACAEPLNVKSTSEKEEIKQEQIKEISSISKSEDKKTMEQAKTEPKVEVPAKEIVKPQTIEQKKTEPYSHVLDINYEFRGEGIFLTWVAPEDAIPYVTSYRIYLFTSFPKNPEKAIEQGKGKRVGEVVHPEMSFYLPKIDRKRVNYLAVSVKHGREEEQLHFILEESLAKVEPEKESMAFANKEETEKTKEKKESENPISKTSSKSTDAAVEAAKEEVKHEPTPAEEHRNEPEVMKPKNENLEFEQILNKYYKKKKYEQARTLFDNYAQKETEIKNKAKALFYSALCDYNLGNYERSLNKLLQKEMKNFSDQARVDFYINRCTEKRK